MFNEYDKVIKDYLKEDIVQIVPPSEEIVLPGSTHYLPHRAVIKENRETMKVRIVFDTVQMSHLLMFYTLYHVCSLWSLMF